MERSILLLSCGKTFSPKCRLATAGACRRPTEKFGQTSHSRGDNKVWGWERAGRTRRRRTHGGGGGGFRCQRQQQQMFVMARALERQQSNPVDKWVADGSSPAPSSRWGKVKSAFQWKPSTAAAPTVTPTSTSTTPTAPGGEGEGEPLRAKEFSDVVGAGGGKIALQQQEQLPDKYREVFAQAKKQVIVASDLARKQIIVAADYVKSLDLDLDKVKSSLDPRKLKDVDVRKIKDVDLKKLVSSVGEHTRETATAATAHLPRGTVDFITGLAIIFLIPIFLDNLIYRISRIGANRRSKRRKKEMGSDLYGAGVVGAGRGGVAAGSVARAGAGVGNSVKGKPAAAGTLSAILEREQAKRKESVEWLNMVVGKLWNLYRRPLEGSATSMLQPILDDLEKPDVVKKVAMQSFFMGDDPLTIRTVERRTSRRADDLQYQMAVRYTGGARVVLGITLKWWILSVTIPVGVRGLDVDAEVWVKLRMIPVDPWVGQLTWAFVTLPRIRLTLAPFKIVNLNSIPFLSKFLAKLLTEDLPMPFVRPNKSMVDLLEGKAVAGVSNDFNTGKGMDGTRSFSGELSVTLLEANKVSYIPYLATDPYCIFTLSEQVQRSKRNSQTSRLGPPGAPVWNQDFQLLVVDHKVEQLSVTLWDTIGFTSYPVGAADLDLRTLQDTVPVDRKLALKSGWGPFPRRFAGEVMLRLTYKAYINEDEDANVGGELTTAPKGSDVEQAREVATLLKEEAGNVAELFEEKHAAKEMFSSLTAITSEKNAKEALPSLGLKASGGDDHASSSPKKAARLPAKKTPVNGLASGSASGSARDPARGSSAARGLAGGSAGGLFGKLRNGIISKNVSFESSRLSSGFGGRGPAAVKEAGQVRVSNSERPGLEEVSTSLARRQGGANLRQVFLWLAGATAILWILATDVNVSAFFGS